MKPDRNRYRVSVSRKACFLAGFQTGLLLIFVRFGDLGLLTCI